MKKEEMRRKIDEELKHIPRSFEGSDQNLLRAYYNSMRMTDLGRNPSSPGKRDSNQGHRGDKEGQPPFLTNL